MSIAPNTSKLMLDLFGSNIYQGFDSLLPEDLQGWHSDHWIFADLVSEIRPSVIIDVGVWKGRSTIFLANLLQEREILGLVIGVDTFLGSPENWDPGRPSFPGLRLKHGYPHLYWQFLSNVLHRGCADRVVPLPNTTENAVLILQRLGIIADLIHIDAAHEYASAIRDMRAFWSLLRPGGAMVGDDYNVWPGVKRAADEFAVELGLPISDHGVKWLIRKVR